MLARSTTILLTLAFAVSLPLSARTEKKKKPRREAPAQDEVVLQGPGNAPAEDGDATGQNQQKKSDPKLTARSLNADVALCDGRTLKGKVQLELPDSISFVHVVDGLEFQKRVRPGDIRSIEFERWAPSEMEQRKTGRIFRFDVTRFRVELSNQVILTVEKPMPSYLGHMTFSNKNGNILLYSYWMDLLKPDNTWYTGIQGPANGDRTFCHKDVIKKLTFSK